MKNEKKQLPLQYVRKSNKNAASDDYDDNEDVDDNNIHQNLFPVKGKGCKIKAVIVSKM